MGDIHERQINKKGQVSENTLSGVVCCNSGCAIAPVFKRIYVKELDKNVVRKVDETNIFEFIQASKSITDLAVLQKRFLELGEIPSDNLNYGSNDLTVFPSDIHGVYQMVNDVAANFNKLPQSIQDIFGNKDNYLKSILDGSYNAVLINAINDKLIKKEDVDPQKGD